MSQLHSGVKALSYQLADCRDMAQFEDESFGGVIDKGTIDAVLCGTDSAVNTIKILMEAQRWGVGQLATRGGRGGLRRQHYLSLSTRAIRLVQGGHRLPC